MKHLSLSFRLSVITILFGMIFANGVYSQGLGEIKQLCKDATAANKALARQAGYDLDQLCREVNVSEAADLTVSLPEMVGRATSSSTEEVAAAVAPVAVAGLGEKISPSELRPFGYDLFANVPSTFAPAASIPVSGDYILGPGDTLNILFYGKTNNAFSLDINREGYVDFPELGPVGLAGLSYAEAKEMLQTRISAQIIGTQASISMGSLRSMQIFVLGEAFKPGAYTVSSLSTITHALISSGGVSDIGSLRNIQLKRRGKLVAVLDLYDLLLFGDTQDDVRLQAGDVIYIPTVGDLVSVEGQVLRPAIYELKGGETVRDLIILAGDFGPKAFEASSKLQRINEDGFMTVLDLALTEPEWNNVTLHNGDHLIIDAISDYKKDIVSVSGAVRHGGDFSWKKGMKISDILTGPDKLNPDADLDVGLLIREIDSSADIEVFTFRLGALFSEFPEQHNLELKSRDKLIVLSDYQDRAAAVAPFIGNLKRQASVEGLPRVVRSGGTVRFPGEYPLASGMTVKDLIDLSGGLIESAYSQSAEISRLDISDPYRARTSIIVSKLLLAESTKLEPNDYVEFRMLPDFSSSPTITLGGEFLFPGVYVFEKGETLNSVIERAGGFTDEAFLGGAIYMRKSLRQKEQSEIDRLLQVINDDLTASSLRDNNSGITVNNDRIAIQRAAIASLSDAEPIGRLVVPLSEIVANQAEDILLKDEDKLIVPKLSQEVTVIGEVRRPTSYMFDPKFSQADYIKQSGGFKDRANKRDVFVVKANGEVILPNRSLFKFISKKNSIGPGDTIIVPLDTNEKRLQGMPLIAEVSTIIYQLALGSAALKSFDND